ncbi:hypothetical protein BIV57_20150 [Mangrovactinospora gilvigrisea]|uniref:Metallo-beta-lactamase domain-containing protein n=1 Tax=Mangrovactinospora gilvigrisea TaxID=1428644 RepID=A0A1J7BAS9_9ACTN|nr:MBL fold metallo-hydrolase [Mangrovactinospora gilvigrisea]OIV35717.1 hypothetical protein BIV57_20150 [Mangrovactinospora gilvigrisea]
MDAITGWSRAYRFGDVDVTAGLVAGRDGVLAVDPGPTPADGRRLAELAEAEFGLPVRWAVLTHAHWDHVYGAAGLPPDAVLLGRLGIGAELERRRADDLADAIRHGLPEEVARDAANRLRRPDREVGDTPESLQLDLGGRWVELVHPGPAHTAHDLAVVVHGTPRVVFCGDLVEESGPPQAGEDADPAAWPAALDVLLAAGGPDARYVPGHGAPVDAAFVRHQRAQLAEQRP